MDIVPYEERCHFCRKRKHTKLCDFVVGKLWTSIDCRTITETCDHQMCDECATELSPGFDFCPKHVEETKKKIWK